MAQNVYAVRCDLVYLVDINILCGHIREGQSENVELLHRVGLSIGVNETLRLYLRVKVMGGIFSIHQYYYSSKNC